MADRPTYTRAQLEQYFDRIVLPQRQRIYSVTEQLSNGSTTAEDQLAYLTRLVKHQVVKVPFENLSLHYSWHRTINVRPQHLFRKIVEKQPHAGAGSGGDGEPRPWQCHRGGYCMEANSFFHTVLRSLGYNVYLAGARVFNPQTQRYGGFSHCVNIVTLLGDDGVLQKYMVDVAFGANEAAMPLPLTANTVHTQIAPGQMRLVYEALPQNLNQDSKCWVYQQRIQSDAEWTPAYCFVDFEFLPEDIAGMNLSPWKSPSSFFHQKVLVVRFTTDREELVEFEEGGEDGPGSPEEVAVAEGELDGTIILDHDKLKWRRNGETKLEVVLKTDAERVEALRRYFGIVFDEEDLVAIKGTKGEIKS